MSVILIVDQDPLVRKTLLGFLHDLECKVIEASSIDEAAATVYSEKPDLLITNLFLPDRDGLVFIRKLTRELPGMGIIALDQESEGDKTSYGGLALACGASAVLTKPILEIDFVTAIRDLLGTL